mgnify:CR=1
VEPRLFDFFAQPHHVINGILSAVGSDHRPYAHIPLLVLCNIVLTGSPIRFRHATHCGQNGLGRTLARSLVRSFFLHINVGI